MSVDNGVFATASDVASANTNFSQNIITQPNTIDNLQAPPTTVNNVGQTAGAVTKFLDPNADYPL